MHFANRRDSEWTRLPIRDLVYSVRRMTTKLKVGLMDVHILWENIPERLEMKRVRPEKNERRFYALEITIDLFGGLSVARNWGRIGTCGRQRLDPHVDLADAGAALNRLAQKKRRRGYQRY
jgi:predicted DNA-binding WGR domain protein